MNVKTYPLLRGLLSYILPRKIFERPGSGGTFSAEYCYSVWLRHLVELKKADLIKNVNEIKSVAEIGPGDSLGIGIAAVFSGINEYYGFDVIRHANKENNIKIAQGIMDLYLKKYDIPNGPKLKDTNPKLKDYRFPEKTLGIEINDDYFLKNRLKEITDALNEQDSGIEINYVVPWDSSSSEYTGRIDLIYSQAVMEHVEDIESAYNAMYKWLKPGGILSHQIDFKTHEMTNEWNGHWYISNNLWRFLLHGRKYSINRLPVSAHLSAIQKAGFTIKNVLPLYMENKFGNRTIQVKRHTFQKDDYRTSSALIQAVK
jgi:hypothetical protein